MTPQPRPRSKGPRPEEPAPEVLTPDAVWDDDDELVEAPPERPDRRPLWALIAGISAMWFTLNGAVLFFLPLALVGVFAAVSGWRHARRLKQEGGSTRAQRQATWGFRLGVLATVLTIAQIVYFVGFYEWDKTDDDIQFNDDKTETPTTGTEPAGEPSGGPEG